ncbi:hypothetical protein KCP71_04255 [Salmonella enterica subsp. enterica]|nr:hypothetical protein KCP71_04255 [Salmonella enterica subsp. enterica]
MVVARIDDEVTVKRLKSRAIKRSCCRKQRASPMLRRLFPSQPAVASPSRPHRPIVAPACNASPETNLQRSSAAPRL